MPRNPAVKKGHNVRHENGLVGPGKRVSKQKSNGQLSGNVKSTASTDEPLPTPTNATFAERESSIATGVDGNVNGEANSSVDDLRWRKRGSDSSSDFQDQRWESQPNARVMDATLARSRNVQELSAVQIASTILTSNPAGDTIALLIVLLALPSLILTIVQALFASLTLMPPTGSVSPVSFLSLFDVFQGSAGSPSISTMAVVDVICFGLWMSLWTWAQNFALDLAQVQIAMTLGSGTSGKNGSVNSVCFFLVLFLHAAKSSGLKRFVSAKLLPASFFDHPRVALLSSYLPQPATFGLGMSTPSRIRSLFAIHIISQALMAFVRRRLAGTSSSQRVRRLESDATSITTTALDSSAQDTLFNTAASPGSDQVPPPTPTIREARERTLTAKKRRRQANQVRSRQPFWAALASTKVHVLREVEQKKEKVGVNGQHEATSRVDSNDYVYITGVEPSAIHFEACHLGFAAESQHLKPGHGSRPIYVRINNARWHSVSLEVADDHEGDDGESHPKWIGSIAGLAPDCNYVCSFRRVMEDDEITAVMVRTPPLFDRDQGHASVPPPVRQVARPSSPTTTLKTSIQTAERSREDANNRRNKLRRNHRNALAKLDREIETLQNKLKSASDDHKQKQKLLQFERYAKQHEEAINALSLKLDELETIPEEETVEYDRKKSAYDERNRAVTAANESLNKVKAESKAEHSVVSNELASIVARKDRLAARNAKLAADTERLTQANLQNMSEKERKEVESATREQVQVRQTSDWKRRINDLDAQLNTVRLQTEKVFREIEEAIAGAAGPLTPEGELPGTHGSRSMFFGSINASTFVPDPQASPFQSQAQTSSLMTARPRSNTNQSLGAMSGMSGEFDDADPIPPMPAHLDFDVPGVRERKGSGSSRGQNNHSPGIIGGALRSPHKGSHSPGQFASTNTW